MAGGKPLILQAEVVIAADDVVFDVVTDEVVVILAVVAGVVEIALGVVAGVVEIALGVVAGVVEIAFLGVVDGEAGVVEAFFAAGVVDNCLFFLPPTVQATVMVTWVLTAGPVCVAVFVTSVKLNNSLVHRKQTLLAVKLLELRDAYQSHYVHSLVCCGGPLSSTATSCRRGDRPPLLKTLARRWWPRG